MILSTLTDSEIIGMIRPDLDDAEQYSEDLGEIREENYALYRAEPYGNEIQGWASVVDPVIWDAIEGIMPSLVEIFNDDWFMLRADDPERADNFKELIRYQLYCQQDGYKTITSFLRDTLLYHFGVLKISYVEDYESTDETFSSITPAQMAEIAGMSEVDITKYDEITTTDPETGVETTEFQNVKLVRHDIKYRGPAAECIPPWEFGFSPGYAELDDCPIVYHKVRRTLSYIKQKEVDKIYKPGSYDALVDRGLEPSSDEETQYNLTTTDYYDDTQPSTSAPQQIPNQEVDIYECYVKLDVDGDGISEDCIVTVALDVVLSVELNPYRRPPFRLGIAIPESHKIPGIPYAEILSEDQKTMTNLKRLVQDSAAQACYQNPITDDPNMFNMLVTRKPMQPILGNPQRVSTLESQAPNQFILKAIEMAESDIENKTGVTRYNQGLDADSLNKTATGVSMIMTAAQQRLRMVARNIGNIALKGMIRDFIFINQKWPGTEDMQIIGKGISINPDDLSGQYDISVQVGVGPQEKQQAALIMDQLVQFQLQAGLQLQLCTPNEIYETLKRKYKLLNVDIDDLLIDPSSEEVYEQTPMQQQSGQQPGGVSPNEGAGPEGQGVGRSPVPPTVLQRGGAPAEQPDLGPVA